MLVHLDLSGNKLRSLPAELGDMTHLKELLLNNNNIRVLPYELGKLFMLEVSIWCGLGSRELYRQCASYLLLVNLS